MDYLKIYKFMFVKKIQQFEVAWSLGLALKLLLEKDNQ